MISSWSPASWTSSTWQSTQARLPTMTGAPVTGGWVPVHSLELVPSGDGESPAQVLLVVAQNVHTELPGPGDPRPAGRGAGRSHGDERGVDGQRDEALTGEPHRLSVLHAGDDGHSAGEPAHGVLERADVEGHGQSAAQVHRRTLGGGGHLEGGRCGGQRPGLLEHPVDLVVGVGRVVVEQGQSPDPGLSGHQHGIVGRRMPPVGQGGELLLGVLGVVEEQVRPVAQLEHARLERTEGPAAPDGPRGRPAPGRRPPAGTRGYARHGGWAGPSP